MFAPYLFKEFEDCLVVEVGVIVMHFSRIGVVVVDNIGWDPFAKICLEGIDAHIKEHLQFALVPRDGFRVREIDKAHPSLPSVPLPHISLGSTDQIPMLHPFVKQLGFLGDIRVDPHTNVQAFRLEASEHPNWVRELVLVPGKIDPLVFFHPKAVKMEHM